MSPDEAYSELIRSAWLQCSALGMDMDEFLCWFLSQAVADGYPPELIREIVADVRAQRP